MSQHRPGLSSTACPFCRHGSLTVPSKTCWHLCLKAPLPCRYPSAFLRVPPRRLDPTPQFPSRIRAGRSRSPCPAPGAPGAAAAEPGGLLLCSDPPGRGPAAGCQGRAAAPFPLAPGLSLRVLSPFPRRCHRRPPEGGVAASSGRFRKVAGRESEARFPGSRSQTKEKRAARVSLLFFYYYFIRKSHPETLVHNKYIDSYQEYIKNKDTVLSLRP